MELETNGRTGNASKHNKNPHFCPCTYSYLLRCPYHLAHPCESTHPEDQPFPSINKKRPKLPCYRAESRLK